MKERILNNFGLKILSLFLALILWLTIINVIDPSNPRVISNIPVELINKDTLTKQGYTFEVLEGNTTTIVVDGPQSITDKLVASDFYASADFSTINPLSDYIDINVKCIKSGVNQNSLSIKLRVPTVKINIENRETKSFEVSTVCLGTVASGYSVGKCEVSPMSVKITGAESIVESIAEVVAEYDVEGASMDVTDDVAITLYDESGNKMDTESLVLSRDTVKIKIPILINKTVPVNYAYTGTVDDGYKVSGVTASLDKVIIAGTQEDINAINSIDVPADVIDVSGLSADKAFEVRVGHYVPSNVKIISETTSTVTVSIEKLVTKDISIPANNIVLENTNQAFKYTLAKEPIVITCSGFSKDIESLDSSAFKVVADVSGIGTGIKQVKLSITIPDNCSIVGEYFASMTVSK